MAVEDRGSSFFNSSDSIRMYLSFSTWDLFFQLGYDESSRRVGGGGLLRFANSRGAIPNLFRE